ncbi:MAG: hypothetical protein ABR569_13420 [Gaiellaceae bacterium]
MRTLSVPHGTDEAEDRHSNFYDVRVNLHRGDQGTIGLISFASPVARSPTANVL